VPEGAQRAGFGMEGRSVLFRLERWYIAAVLVLAALALGVGLWHGLPNVYVPDTHIIRNALGMAKTQNLWPPSGMYSTYPYLLSYLLLPVYAGTFILGRAMGIYASADDFGQKLIEDPTAVYLEARILIALFGLVAVIYLYRAARRMGWSHGLSAGAALLLAFSPLFVQLGHHSRPWIPMVAGVAFVLYHSAGIALSGRPRDYVLAGIGAGLTFAMHQVGCVAFLIPVAAHFAGRGREVLSGQAIRLAFLLLLLFAGAAFFLGYGHLVFGGDSVDVIATDKEAVGLGGQKLILDSFSGQRAGKTISAMFGYDPICTVLGLVGLVIGIAMAGFNGLRCALLVFGLLFTVFMLLYDNAHIRYMLPLLPALALGAALAAAKAGKFVRWKEGWLLVPLVLFSAVQTARMDYLFCQTDTRDQARTWIEENIPSGARIAAEGYTAPLTPTLESLLFLKNNAGVWLKRKENQIVERGGAGEGPTYFMIPLERFYRFQSYWPHQYLLNGDRPIADFLDDMGAEWVMLYDRWPHEERHPPLLEYLAARDEPGPVFSPAAVPDPPEATLPMDMDFPLTSLWTLERPGPVLKLFRLKR
jgi:hypothetical protein